LPQPVRQAAGAEQLQRSRQGLRVSGTAFSSDAAGLVGSAYGEPASEGAMLAEFVTEKPQPVAERRSLYEKQVTNHLALPSQKAVHLEPLA
jgi:hypothetical protein